MNGPSSAIWHDGLPEAIDAVAEHAPASHRFLRRAWYAAAARGRARTLVVDGGLALPVVPRGARVFGLVEVPGCYWPLRSFPLVDAGAIRVALPMLAQGARAIRIGPVPDGDPAVAPLVAAARAAGWAVLDRFVAHSWVLDIAAFRTAGGWPRTSTLKKNRFHEKHLAEHGALEWRFLGTDDWPAAFDMLGEIERKSWIAARTDGRDAKFTHDGHLALWRGAARDPVLAAMMRAALLTVDGRAAAFSFDMEVGATCYAIANSYDPAFAKHSPGKLLYWRNLSAMLAREVATVDWGAGDSGYKQVIGAVQGPAMRDWLLVRPGVSAAVARRLAGIWTGSGQHDPAHAPSQPT
ncbi:GNAT family N-acetyltransferase [Microvirga sp. SRT01]|uniref:GNAT family N-acetyltransferase n=1 Tax=Sphingomonas longa TaxID=2778730 RepID=A0ABS2D6D0_9SPHN|nr:MULTISPECIES: GNAT family N-acetyltransferase [Alphaproteobacteria]MBM6576486.1 GNAT family N-acetyltransferase [Sphingomonas sp. BT552]MBR7709532.1 GNAT family N-acetyltransferase [Microvirga sp. SRT01]